MPPVVDLFTPEFPHGTLTGYADGCKGSACAHHGDPAYYSCKEVAELVRTDYALRNWGVLERMPRASNTPIKHAAPTAPPAEVNADREVEASVGLRSTPEGIEAGLPDTDTAASAGGPEHGTTARYQRGCRQDLDCPNYKIDGTITCAEARRQYMRDWAATRREKAAAEALTPSIEEAAAATDLTASSIEHRPATEQTSDPDPAPIHAAAGDVDEAGYLDDVAQPHHQNHVTFRDADQEATAAAEAQTGTPDDFSAVAELQELRTQVKRINGEKIRLEQDLERAHTEINRLERQHHAADNLLQESRRRDTDLVAAGTGGESPTALAESIELTVRGVHLSLPADSAVEVRALGEAVYVRAGR